MQKSKTNNYIRVGTYGRDGWEGEHVFFLEDEDQDERRNVISAANAYAASLRGSVSIASFWPMRGIAECIMPVTRENVDLKIRHRLPSGV